MHHSTVPSSPDACPASAVIMAARLAKTPLAIADAHAPGRPIMFANDAFAALVAADAAALVGLPLATLVGADIEHDGTTRFELARHGSAATAAALSVATVPAADGEPFCLLCSLVDARGEGADAAIDRDAELLAQVARAAGDLMRESAVAALAGDRDATAAEIALAAVDHVTQPPLERHAS